MSNYNPSMSPTSHEKNRVLSEVNGKVKGSLELIFKEDANYKGRIEFSSRNRISGISRLIKSPYGGNSMATVYGLKGSSEPRGYLGALICNELAILALEI
jgi:hypothetical protein